MADVEEALFVKLCFLLLTTCKLYLFMRPMTQRNIRYIQNMPFKFLGTNYDDHSSTTELNIKSCNE